MTRSHGRLAELYIDNESAACQVISGDLSTITFNDPKTTPESTALGDSTVQRETDGIRDGTLDMTAIYSTGTGACVSDLLEGMQSGSDVRRIQYYPGGRFAASPVISACMQLNNYSVTTPADGISQISAGLEVGKGDAVHSSVYQNKVLFANSASLIGYWPLFEFSGTTASNLEGTAARNGTYSAIDLGRPGIGDGKTSASLDGASSFINIYSTSLNTAFDGGEGTALIWAKARAAGVWTDDTIRYIFIVRVDANNFVRVWKQADNILYWDYIASGTLERVSKTTTTTNWMTLGITWSTSASQVKMFFDGTQEGSTQTGLGIWAGNLSSTEVVIGAADTIPAGAWDGFEAQGAIWKTALTVAQMNDLASFT